MGQHRTNRTPPLTVSVAIPTIPGREDVLRRAVASAHAQDRSADAILVERDAERTGAARTRNRMIERCATDVIAWLDDDDLFLPNHLKACLRVLRDQPDVDLVYPRPRMSGGLDPTAVTYRGRFPVEPWGIRWQPELERHLRTHGSFIPMTHLVRTSAVRRAGGFPEGRVLPSGRYQGEDERYLIALLDSGGRFAHLDLPTWTWTVNPHSTAGRGVAEAQL